MESKQEICEALLVTLQLTDNLHDLSTLEYDEEKEVVKATFDNGYTKFANVCMDSGTAMILDIVRQIL